MTDRKSKLRGLLLANTFLSWGEALHVQKMILASILDSHCLLSFLVFVCLIAQCESSACRRFI